MEETPANAKGPAHRHRKPANPMVRPKRPGQVRPPQPQAPPAPNRPGQPGVQNGTPPTEQRQPALLRPPSLPQQADGPYEDTPIYTTKKALLEGIRHHIMRLYPNTADVKEKQVNIADQSQFTPPVRLHRRDPRRDPVPAWRNAGEESSEDHKPDLVDDKAREQATIAKQARAAEREANRAQIAPTAKSEAADRRKKERKQKKTEMVYQFTDSATKLKNQQLRYEEAKPWHLEDFDNANLWAGTYESALSECHVMLVEQPDQKSYSMVPLEKWYKFLPKSRLKAATHEEAERRMRQQQDLPDWVKKAEATERRKLQDEQLRAGGKLYTRQGERGERPARAGAGGAAGDDEGQEQAEDVDTLDYDYEEAFADDEENQLFGGDDEEAKEAEQRVKREQGEANIFKDIKEEKDYEQEEEQKRLQEEADKEKGRKVTKALKKRERDWRYEDDSGEEDSDSSEDEEEDVKNEDQTENEKKPDVNVVNAPEADKPKTGTQPTGRNTPTADPSRNTLKRPVSPNQSDLSGNESSRKKQKKTHLTANAPGTGPSISRPSSPDQQAGARKGSTIKLNTGARKIVDGGAGLGSDGEMSDGKKKKKKISRPASRQISPGGSRAASPSNVSTAGTNGTSVWSHVLPPAGVHISPDELRSRITPAGVHISELRKVFPISTLNTPGFAQYLKQLTILNHDTKMMTPRVTPLVQKPA